MSINYSRCSCRVCNGSNLVKVLELGPTPIGDDYIKKEDKNILQPYYPLDVYLCQDCGLVQLIDIISPENIYPNKYIYLTRTSLDLQTHFEKYAENIMQQNLPQNSLAIDIGSNDGTFLQALKRRGFQVLGIEPSKHIAELAKKEGIPTIQNYFGENTAIQIKNDYGPAHFISTNNVFANIDDLDDIVNGICVLLEDDGIYTLECSYLADLVENLVFDSIYHEHISYFSIKPLKLLFEHHNMELFDIVHTNSKGGSIRVFFQKKGGPRRITPHVQAAIDYENSKNIHKLSFFEKFRQRIDITSNAVSSILRKIKNDGEIIACFGASPTTCTLIHHFKIQNFIDFYVDENKIKIGKFSPGMHIEVFSPEILLNKKPKYTFIAAWRFSNSIIEKNKKYIEQGGTFIIPLPSLRFVGGINNAYINDHLLL